jgi:UDP-N-acetylmuramoyl-tripeptide--D-alanyl-D-alanine ligase
LYGIEPDRLKEPVRKLLPGKMRGERFHHRGVLVYNDCYNSNPDAARSMLDVLKDTPARRRIAVLGEMLELGRLAEPLHRDVGSYAAELGIDVLVGIRGAACCTLDAATRAGLRAGAAFFFEHPAEAGRFLRTFAQPGDAILFKGSRGVHVERALEEFLNPDPVSEEGGRS